MLNRIAFTMLVTLGMVQLAEAQSPDSLPIQPTKLMAPVDANPGSSTAQPKPLPPTPAVTPAATTKGVLLKDEGPLAPAPIVDQGPPVHLEPIPAESGPSDHWWLTGDFILGWVRSSGTPPLFTTSPAGTPQLSAGVVGDKTTVLFGNDNYGGDVRPGFRLGGGAWFDADRTLGIDVGFFMLDNQNDNFFASSPAGSPILARPFFDVSTGLQSAQLLAFPGLDHGSVAASARSNEFYGFNLDFQEVFASTNNARFEGLLGYRFLRFNDGLLIDTNSVASAGPLVVAGTQTLTSDRFTAENSFNGVDFGARAEFFGQRWSLDLLAKLAVGSVNRSVGIEGTTEVMVPGSAPATSNGGILALGGNSGVHTSNDWVIAPEAGVTFAWELTDHICLRLGYSFLYWTNVVRASNEVSTNVNSQLFPPPVAGATPVSPTFVLEKSDIWVQTINLGLEIRF
jgi:hypothetical protein